MCWLKDERSGIRRSGYAPKGMRTTSKMSFLHKRNTTVLPLVHAVEGVAAYMVCKGSVNGDRLVDFAQTVLVGSCPPKSHPFARRTHDSHMIRAHFTRSTQHPPAG